MEFTSFSLHLLAMLLMLSDHMWATIIPGHAWMTWIGRLAFPIFAFMIVEGYFHTRSLKRYMGRLLVLALLSEIPFNLMYGGSALYPFHQNVIWTFLIGLGCIFLIEKSKEREKLWLILLVSAVVSALGYILGYLAMVDYYGCGVLTVLVFYFFRGDKPQHRLAQLVGLWIINGHLLAGLTVPITLFGISYDFPQQGIAVLALIPIWLYHGKQGPHNRWIQLGFYAFYPLHILILSLIWLYA